MRITARMTAVVLAALSALHLAWGLGSFVPAPGTRDELADAVVGTTTVPPPLSCFAVAGALAAGAALAAGVAPLPPAWRQPRTPASWRECSDCAADSGSSERRIWSRRVATRSGSFGWIGGSRRRSAWPSRSAPSPRLARSPPRADARTGRSGTDPFSGACVGRVVIAPASPSDSGDRRHRGGRRASRAGHRGPRRRQCGSPPVRDSGGATTGWSSRDDQDNGEEAEDEHVEHSLSTLDHRSRPAASAQLPRPAQRRPGTTALGAARRRVPFPPLSDAGGVEEVAPPGRR